MYQISFTTFHLLLRHFFCGKGHTKSRLTRYSNKNSHKICDNSQTDKTSAWRIPVPSVKLSHLLLRSTWSHTPHLATFKTKNMQEQISTTPVFNCKPSSTLCFLKQPPLPQHHHHLPSIVNGRRRRRIFTHTFLMRILVASLSTDRSKYAYNKMSGLRGRCV